ncbi:glycosyltransferase family 4 protein [Methylomonas sp. YC3]
MKIVIFQPMLKFYRVPLFEKLHRLLTESGHELRLVFGTPWNEELKRGDNVVLENDYCIFEKSHWFLRNKVHFMEGAIHHILWADIIITEQANKHIYNYILIFLSFIKVKRFAYWGHGLNRQGRSNSVREKIKKALATQTNWWFAYTAGVAGYLKDIGYPSEQITVLNNSVDTRAFKNSISAVTEEEIAEFKQGHNIEHDSQVGIFCGSLHRDKKIEFLLDAALVISQKEKNFILLIGGDGLDRKTVMNCAKHYDFIKYLGPLHAKQKALAFKCADVFLNPGMVGLAILDAFSAGLPVITTHQAEHSPEIDYLQNGFNGMITNLDAENYGSLVTKILRSKEELITLQKNALASSDQFSIENMANNFFEGIKSFINHSL